MRWTRTFCPTLKEAPADTEILSHKLLLRAGLIRKLAGGLYTFLPLGLRSLRKIERIVREEMDRAGALEVAMPCLQPPDIWQQSGRYESAAEVLFRVKDRAEREWLLGPTHEEVITALAAAEISSYRHLPKTFYQVGVKFRDEIRPRFGLMRAREFLMKDAYSFDASDDAAGSSYQQMFAAYQRVFARCGLKAIPVEADSGVIGGKFSHEFMVPAEVGESEIVYCDSGLYAANLERATSRGPLVPTPTTNTGASPEKFPTPGAVTIQALAQPPYGVPPHQQIKTLVYVVEGRLVLLLLRGDDSLNEAKLAGVLGTGQFRAAEAEEIRTVLGALPGSLGAVAGTLQGAAGQLAIYADAALRGAAGMTTGANEDGFHLRHVAIDRDMQVTHWTDLRTVAAGELCVVTGQPLRLRRAIEVGHVFKLGTKYSEKLNAMFLDEQGRSQPCVMGCYGIGVTRTLQAVIEQGNDQNGIIWPQAVAPYVVCVTPLNVDSSSPVMRLAKKIYAELAAAGVEVILDDRNERPGVKFKDSELVGFPLRIGIGERSLARGEVELKPRTGAVVPVKAEEAVQRVVELLSGLP